MLVRDGSGRCDQHKRVERQAHDAQRGSANERGYTYKWQQASKGWLAKHPLCVHHEERGQVEAATVVDHIVPHRLKDAEDSGDQARIEHARALFWDRNNWQSLCKRCHDRKTVTETGAHAARSRR